MSFTDFHINIVEEETFPPVIGYLFPKMKKERKNANDRLQNHTMVTLEDKMDIERKGQQSIQRQLYVRFICFGNGTLGALYDRSYGFYRRQLILTTKDRPANRVDDPFLAEKLKAEAEGILLWCLEGLKRLQENNYEFTLSDRTKKNLEDAMADGNNIIQFMESEGYIRLERDCVAASAHLYVAYCRWCKDNLETPLSKKSFTNFLSQNAAQYGIISTKHALNNQRGYRNILVLIDPSRPVSFTDNFM